MPSKASSVNVRAPSTKIPSPTSSRASSPTQHAPTEITTLLPPPSSHTPEPALHGRHDAKAANRARSVSGRSYGAIHGPGPVQQAPRVSKAGQRRILTTLPIQTSFSVLVALTFLSFVLTLILFLNTAMDFTSIAPPYRGSGFSEFWISAIGSWCGLGGVFFHSHPSFLFFITTMFTIFLHIPLVLLIILSPPLSHRHTPLIFVPLGVTALTLLFAVLSNYLVRRARYLESQRIQRMLSDAAARERGAGDEAVSRALVGVQGKGVWGRLVSFFSGVFGLIAGLAACIIVALLLIDMSISAYDGSEPLPSSTSQLWTVKPPGSPWSIKVHLACTPPPESTLSKSRNTTNLPTILYEPSSGVPGSLALLDIPLPPAGDQTVNPGRWLLDMQESGKVGTVCVWDRPGYGFSQVSSDADLNSVTDVLWMALQADKQVKSSAGKHQFMLIGEGYGGLITRVFAAKHPESIHSIIHLDAQTASTYFSEYPNGRSYPALMIHRVATRLLPALLTPLSITRFPSVILRRSSSLSRILASSKPEPSTTYLNENIQKARLQETFGAHSHTSSSFRALLASGAKYPSMVPAIVISDLDRMNEREDWAQGQESLAKEVTSEEGLVEWIKLEGSKKGGVCQGRGKDTCQGAVERLMKIT